MSIVEVPKLSGEITKTASDLLIESITDEVI